MLIAAAIVIVIVAGVGGGGVFAYSTIKNQAGQLQSELTVHLQTAQAELEAAKTSLKLANTKRDATQITQARTHFTTAKAQFTLARQIADNSQLLKQLEGVPAVGGQVRSRHTAVDAIADMGIAITDAGQELATLDLQIIKPSTAGGKAGTNLLAVLGTAHKSLVIVRTDLARAQTAAARVDLKVLPSGQQGTFGKARDTITSALAAIDQFEGLVPSLTELLGGNGARNFLIEQVNPAELRPGGGFIGTYSVLRADHGTLKLLKSGDAYALSNPRPGIGQLGYIVPPGPLRESVTPNKSWSFLDSNFYPDFPSNAKTAESFVQPRLGIKIDAVISIDYYTIAKLLELTGPMAVPGFGVTVNASNFIPLVIQYDLSTTSATHKGLLSAVAGPLLQRVASLSPGRWQALIQALNSLSAARHLQAYFNNPIVEKQISLFGWSGTLNTAAAPDYMMEVESNLGGTKANYFITRHYTVELTRNGATLHHKVTVDILDNMPFNYRPTEFYKAYLRLYVNKSASPTANNLRPVVYPNPAPPAGTRLMDGWVPTFHGYGHSAQAVFEYNTPWHPDAQGQAQVYWQKQPGTLDDKVDVIWKVSTSHTYKVSGTLGQDLVIGLSTNAVTLTLSNFGHANVPSLSLG